MNINKSVQEFRKNYDVLSYRDFKENCVQGVYANIIALLSEYSVSECFTNAVDSPESLLYYRRRIDAIEMMINQIYGDKKLVEFLLSVTGALKEMICSCSCPGVPSSWYDINPKLRFYCAAFDIAKADPARYNRIKSGEEKIQLDYYPEHKDIVEYQEYFRNLKRKNQDKKFRYTEIDFFYQELINTVKIIFDEYVFVE